MEARRNLLFKIMKSLIDLLKNILFFLYPVAHFFLSIADFFLFQWAVKLYRSSKKLTDKKIESLATIVLPILLATLFYDNAVLGTGWLIGEGDLLETLNKLRFLFHYIVVPFFIVVGVEIAHEAGARWANKVIRVLSWLVAAGLAIADILKNYLGLELEPEYYFGMLRYVMVDPSIPIVTIVVNVFMLAIAIGVWIRLKWSILFVGTFIAFVGNAVTFGGTLPGSIAETIMALSLLLTEQFIQIRAMDEIEPDDDSFEKFTWEYKRIPYQLLIPETGDKYEVKPTTEADADFFIYQGGSHFYSDFIQAYVPTKPKTDGDGRYKVISYLHGFALGLPKFYQIHLAKLAAEEGYFVFFPDFQRSTYPDDLEVLLGDNQGIQPTEEVEDSGSLAKLFWQSITKGKDKDLDEENLFDSVKKANTRRKKAKVITRKLGKPSALQYVRLSLALILLILAIRLIALFANKTFGKNFIQLVRTVALSLAYRPTTWGDQAFNMTAIACKKLTEDNPCLEAEFDFYVFGHSLGGLLALSWPYFYQENTDSDKTKHPAHVEYLKRFKAEQILTADPAPSTEMGVPPFIVPFLKIFNIPFLESPVDIADTGEFLKDTPVVILHGGSDRIVRPKQWIRKSWPAKKTNYEQIPKGKKAIYFSISTTYPKDSDKKIKAFHNQAVTDTTYFSDDLFKNFGGVKIQPNIYNSEYVWKGLDLVIKQVKSPAKLLEKLKNKDFDIKTETNFPIQNSPLKPILKAIAIISGLLALYWLVRHHYFFGL